MSGNDNSWTGVILAGGLGSRLRPLTSKIPKPLVNVGNKPMLDYAIDHLKYAGIKKIVIVLKHLAGKINEHIRKNWYDNPERMQDLSIQIPDVDSRDTADALRKVSDIIDTEFVLISMGDIITNLPLKRFLDYHVMKGGFTTISMKTIDQPTQYGVVLLDSNRKIYHFLEKPHPDELYISSLMQRGDLYTYTNLINTGIYAFNNGILNILNTEKTLMDFGRDVFPYLLENNYDLYGFVENYYWMDVGQPETYRWANWDLLRKYGWPITPRGQEHNGLWYDHFPVHGNGCIFEKPAAYGNEIVMGCDNKIKTLVVINDRVRIGDRNVIEKSVLWRDIRIGNDCVIVDSIICDNVIIGNNVKLINAVIGPDCTVMDDQIIEHKKIME
ncbi:MAG: sugar phosphate nucleotidyltransferase [Promethearchaeota archaeon]